MINTSTQYKTTILGKDKAWHGKATITFPNGTILNITDADIMEDGIEIEDATSAQGEFAVGSAIINLLTLTLNNFDHKFDEYDFSGVTIVPYVGLELPDTTIEYLRKGFFTVDAPVTYGSTIVITALDNMTNFDRPYSTSTLVYPATLYQILNDACTNCGVVLDTTTFTNSSYSVAKRPVDTVTFREVVSFVAQLAASFARINNAGDMALGWYKIELTTKGSEADLDGGNFTDYASGDEADGGNFTSYQNRVNYDGGLFVYPDGEAYEINSIASCTVSTDDVRITGVQIIPADENATTYLKGSNGYVISIENNPLAQDGLEQLVVNIAAKLIDFTFRPLTVSCLADPSIEAGDVAVVTYKGNKYATIISNVDYRIGSYEIISGDAESQSEKSSTRYSASSKAVQTAKTETAQQLTAYDVAVKQLNSLMANALGFYQTSFKMEDGSTIDYMHDKPTIADSMIIWKKTIDGFAISTDGGLTYSAGFTANGNAVLKVLTALGINADWINAGTIDAARLNLSDYAKFSSLSTAGQTTINGSNITTGTIDAARLNLTDYAKFSSLSTVGETIITGANITTGRIESADGTVFFDLDSGDLAAKKVVDDAGNVYLEVALSPNGQNKYITLHGTLYTNGNSISGSAISSSSISCSGNITASNLVKRAIDYKDGNGTTQYLNVWTSNL